MRDLSYSQLLEAVDDIFPDPDVHDMPPLDNADWAHIQQAIEQRDGQ